MTLRRQQIVVASRTRAMRILACERETRQAAFFLKDAQGHFRVARRSLR